MAERFWPKVDVRGPDECWPWKGSRFRDGYGQFWAGERRQQNLRAHRVAWELHHGHRMEAEVAMHSCDQPLCCNPRHIRPGIQQENIADRDTKGHASKGARHWNAVLTPEIVTKIREARANGMAYKAIGAQFGVSGSSVFDICQRRWWKHVP